MLADRPSLQLHLQLDYFRSTRPGPGNTAVTLSPLLRAFPDRVKVSLYRSPTLRGLLARIIPRRWDEGWGTWHAKIYGADDELLLTGYVDTIATLLVTITLQCESQYILLHEPTRPIYPPTGSRFTRELLFGLFTDCLACFLHNATSHSFV